MSAERRRQDVGTCEEVALSASFLTSILLDEEHWLSGKDAGTVYQDGDNIRRDVPHRLAS